MKAVVIAVATVVTVAVGWTIGALAASAGWSTGWLIATVVVVSLVWGSAITAVLLRLDR
jgi:hypothetical protein